MALSATERETAVRRLRSLRRKNGVKTANAVRPSLGFEVRYYREIYRQLAEVDQFVLNVLLPVFENALKRSTVAVENNGSRVVRVRNAVEEGELLKIALREFNKLDSFISTLDNSTPEKLASKFVDENNAFHRRTFVREINSAIGINISDIMSENGVRSALQETTNRNVLLIKDLSDSHFRGIKDVVLDTLTGGNDYASIEDALRGRFDMDRRRAKLIASDQTNKLIGDLNRVRQENQGIKKYQWNAIGDARTRPSHKANDGLVFDWSDPSPGGAEGPPGFEVRCRCVADPVLDESILGGTGPGTVPSVPSIVTTRKPRQMRPPAAKPAPVPVGPPRPPVSQFERKVRDQEHKIKDRKREAMIIYDKDGNELYRNMRGGEGSVSFPVHKMVQAKGGTVTHNHPGGGTLSTKDLSNHLEYGTADHRATDPKYTYSMKGAIADPNERKKFLQEHSVAMADVTNKVWEDLAKELDKGVLKFKDRAEMKEYARTQMIEPWHEAAERVTKNYPGLEYRRRLTDETDGVI